MKDFAQMTQEEAHLLREELLRRAADGYEQSGAWHEAAECWADLGQWQHASTLYQRSGDLEHAARALLAAHQYADALALYQQWEGQLLEGNTLAQVRALLGQAACHRLGAPEHSPLSPMMGQQAYQQARTLLTGMTSFYEAQAWEALGEYGKIVKRYDLVQEGYERALELLDGQNRREECVRICNAYLGIVRVYGDAVLGRGLEERLVRWEQEVGEVPKKPVVRPFPVEKLRLLHTITDQTSYMRDLKISPDGRILIGGGYDRTIKSWDLPTGTLIRTFTGHTNTIGRLVISHDGQTLVSGSWDNTIKIWNLLTGKEERTLAGHTDNVYAVVISPDGHTLVSGSADKTIKIWNLLTGKEERTLIGHTGTVGTIAISPNGHTLVSGSSDNTIKIWNLLTGKEEYTLTDHTNSVYSVVISPNGHTLVGGSEDKTIKIWNLLTGKEERTFTGQSALRLVISSDSQTLISGNYNQTIKIWNMRTGKEERTLTGHTGPIIGLAISPNNQILVSSCWEKDPTIKIWGV